MASVGFVVFCIITNPTKSYKSYKTSLQASYYKDVLPYKNNTVPQNPTLLRPCHDGFSTSSHRMPLVAILPKKTG